MNDDLERFERDYKGIVEVYCPYFKEKIAFNAKGLNHLKFKDERKSRPHEEYLVRIRNFKFAPTVISQSYTLQEKQTKYSFIDIKTNIRKERILKRVEYYAFIAIYFDGNYEKRVKVIVREVDGGKKHFWSIMPFWKNIGGKVKLYSGDLDFE